MPLTDAERALLDEIMRHIAKRLAAQLFRRLKAWIETEQLMEMD